MFDSLFVSVPKRIILRLHEQYEQQTNEVTEQFLNEHHQSRHLDHFEHLIAPQEWSRRMYIVLDLYCKANPEVKLQTLDHPVLAVSKPDSLYASPSCAHSNLLIMHLVSSRDSVTAPVASRFCERVALLGAALTERVRR